MSEHLPDCDVRLYGNDTYPIPCTCAEERLLAAEARIAELEAAGTPVNVGPARFAFSAPNAATKAVEAALVELSPGVCVATSIWPPVASNCVPAPTSEQ